jgi:hypothetical protein
LENVRREQARRAGEVKPPPQSLPAVAPSKARVTDPARADRLDLLRIRHGGALADQAEWLAHALRGFGARMRMPVLDLAIHALQPLDAAKRQDLLLTVVKLAQISGKVTLGDFVLLTLCKHCLGPDRKGAPPVKFRSIDELVAEAVVVLSLLAHASRRRRRLEMRSS